MRPIDRVLSCIEGAKKSGASWRARCPAHDDRNPSLSVAEGDDGRVLLHCHAGCEVEAICGALGMEVRELFPSETPTPRTAGSRRTIHETVEDAIRAARWVVVERREGSSWPLVQQHVYPDPSGSEVMRVLRFEEGGEKTFVPIHRRDGGWAIGDPLGKLPLYGLPELDGRDGVYVCEGEKAADAVRALGLTATTSAHGAKSPLKSDWTPLAGRDVIVLPDNDEPGWSYAESVVAILSSLDPPATVKIVELPDIPNHGDAVEFIKARRESGRADEDIRAEIEHMARAAIEQRSSTPKQRKPQLEEYVTFPVDVLPGPVADIVTTMSEAIDCDPAYVALPLLTAAAAAIGNSMELQIKRGWNEPAVIWSAILGESGTAKSPSLDKALGPVHRRQLEAQRAYEELLKLHEAESVLYTKALKRWQRADKGGPPPEKPTEPTLQRLCCSDITVEAVALLLLDQPRGLLLWRDELSGWLQSFNQYKGGKGGDVPHWLEMFGARSLIVDRKSGNPRTIIVRRAAVSITGGIQPGILRRVLGQEYFDNGLAARLLLACPPRRPRRWTETEIPTELEDRLDEIFSRLYGLEPAFDGEERVPNRLQLSPEAKSLWVEFYNAHGEEQFSLHGAMAAAWSKLEGYGARFALLLHVLQYACTERQSGLITKRTLSDAIRLTRWFKHETGRVYALLSETEEQCQLREWTERIRHRGGWISVRDWQRARTLSTAEGARAELQRLVDAGLAGWCRKPAGASGGAPSEGVRLLGLASTDSSDRTPTEGGATGVLSVSEPSVDPDANLGSSSPAAGQEVLGCTPKSDRTPFQDAPEGVLSEHAPGVAVEPADNTRPDTDETPFGEGVLSDEGYAVDGADRDQSVSEHGSDTDKTPPTPTPDGVVSEEGVQLPGPSPDESPEERDRRLGWAS